MYCLHFFYKKNSVAAPPLSDDDVEMDWEWAQQEIMTERAKRDTLDASLPMHIKDAVRVLGPLIQEANAISLELNRQRLSSAFFPLFFSR